MIEEQLRFLIVEDSFSDAALLQRQLEKCVQDPEIRITDSLEKAKHALKTYVPDILFTDYKLGGFNGLDVMKAARQIYPGLPVIVITGTLNDEELSAHIITQGASAYFLKKEMKTLHERLEPEIKRIIDQYQREIRRLKKDRETRDKLEEMNSILKMASKTSDEKLKGSKLEKMIQQLNDHIEYIIR